MDWFKKLKEGDEVIFSTRYENRIATVERFTKTQIVLKETSTRFNRNTGRQIGATNWSLDQISEATPEKKAHVREEQARRKMLNIIDKTNFRLLSYDSLVDIYEVLIRK